MRKITKRNIFAGLLALLLTVSSLMSSVQPAQAATTGAGDYYLKVNKGTNVVTVYKQDGTPYTAFTCSVGYATPVGTFYTPAKYRWWTLDGPSYGQYCTRITRGFLFHSVWYYQQKKNAQSYRQYNKLGTTASHGCVRLTVAASKWIYDNCPLRTKVIIFNGSSKDDPLGKPKTVTVDESKYMGWDPTDPDKDNPYKTYNNKPEIKVSKKTLVLGKPFAGGNMSCKDSGGFDCTDLVKMTGTVNTKKEGDYPVTYSVIDSWGRKNTLSVVYKVRDTEKPYIKGVTDEITRAYNSTYQVKAKISASNVQGQDLTSKIKVAIKKPHQKEYKTYKKDTYTFSKVGTYKIRYTVTNPTNRKVTNKYQTIVVADTSKPILTSEYDWDALAVGKLTKTVSYEQLMEDVSATLSCGTKLDDSVVITVKKPDGESKTLKPGKSLKLQDTGKYKVTYTVKNPTKNTRKNAYLAASKSRALYVVDSDVQLCLYEDLPVEEEPSQEPTDTGDGQTDDQSTVDQGTDATGEQQSGEKDSLQENK